MSMEASQVVKENICNLSYKFRHKIHNLEEKIRASTQTGQYKLEFLRSLLLEFECLIKEIKISDERDR